MNLPCGVILGIMSICMLTAICLNNVCYGAAGDYVTIAAGGTTKIEAEDYAVTNCSAANITTAQQSYAAYASNGTLKYIHLSALPAGGMATMTFNVNAPATGFYQLAAVTSSATIFDYYSPYYLKINSGSYVPVNSTLIQSAAVVGDPGNGAANAKSNLVKYQYKPVYLNAGNNAIVFGIDRTHPTGYDRYDLNVDCIELTPTTASAQDFSYKINAEDASFNSTPVLLVPYTNSPYIQTVNLEGERGSMISVSVTSDTPPADGANMYTATFDVHVPVDGTYKFEAVTSNYASANTYYSTSYKIKVNSDSYFTVGDPGTVLSATKIYSASTGNVLSLYRYKDIHLNAGMNKITFMIDKYATAASSGTTYKYILNLDYMKVSLLNPTSVPSPSTPATPVTAVAAEDFIFTDGSDKYLYSLGDTNYCKASTYLNNYHSSNPASVQLIAVLYNAGHQVVKIHSEDYIIPASTRQQAYIDISGITPAAGSYIKVFVWNNKADMNPLRLQSVLQ